MSDQIVNSIHNQINNYRRSKSLRPLELNKRISDAAELHSKNMASGKVSFSHDGFKNRVNSLKPYFYITQSAENIYFCYNIKDPASEAVKGWLKSPGHHQNIVGNYKLTGIGVALSKKNEYYITQIFITA